MQFIKKNLLAIVTAVIVMSLVFFGSRLFGESAKVGDLVFFAILSAALLALPAVDLGDKILQRLRELEPRVGYAPHAEPPSTPYPQSTHRENLEQCVAREVIHSAMAMGGDGSGAGKMARAAIDALMWAGEQKAGARHDSDCAVHNEPAMPAGPCDCSAPAAAGTLAKRVTPADIEAEIASEHYFTAGEGIAGRCYRNLATLHSPHELELLTICVLVLRNGTKIVGVNYGAIDPAQHDPVLGQVEARAEAVEQVWPLMGYELRTKLAA